MSKGVDLLTTGIEERSEWLSMGDIKLQWIFTSILMRKLPLSSSLFLFLF